MSADGLQSSLPPYHEDAGLRAALFLEKQVFELQAACYQEALSNLPKTSITLSSEMRVPQFLLDRNLMDEYSSKGRLLDNEEITILGMLDAHGKISVLSRLTEFMLFMTRVKKVGRPSLGVCFYITCTNTFFFFFSFLFFSDFSMNTRPCVFSLYPRS
jgi:hypothetical protein